MAKVQSAAHQRPDAHEGLLVRFRVVWIVEAEDSYRGIVETVEDAGAGGKVICAFGDFEVSRVEDDAGDPGCAAKVSEEEIVFPEWIGRRYPLADLGQAPDVREVVEEGEEDREGFLYAVEAVEWPFAVKLMYGIQVDRLAVQPLIGDDVLA